MDEYRARKDGASVPFSHLVTVAQTVGGDTELAAKMLHRGGYEVGEEAALSDDLRYARNWAEKWAPDSMRMRILDPEESKEAAESLDSEQRLYLSEVAGKLDGNMGDGEELQNFLYTTAKEMGVKPKKAFGAIYTVLIGKKSGPKAGPFVAGLPPEIIHDRFDVPDVVSDTETSGGAG
jgi:lysyl-tRNA synthetase class 1